jgi:NADPH:quinone reductase
VQAVVIERGRLLWQERPDPQIGASDLLIAVRAAGVNGADLMQRRGLYPAPPGWPPDIPGLELAGEVVGVGRGVTRFAIGDRVMALVGGGAQATLAAVDEAHALAVPDDVGWAAGGGFTEVFATAFDALFSQAGLRSGERLLVTGAAGGVGCAAVQLAAVAGAHVVASVRDPARREAVGGLGADEVIDPAGVVQHGPYDVVLELVGAASLPAALEALATKGRVVVIGIISGSRLEIDLLGLMGKRARILGSTLRGRSRAEKASLIADMDARVLPLLATGQVHVPVSATLPLREAATAYDRFADGGKLGKIVLIA